MTTFTREMILELMEFVRNCGNEVDDYPEENLISLNAGGGYAIEFIFDENGVLTYVG